MISVQQRRGLSYAIMVAGGLAAALVLGKDFNWDSFAYHMYAGFSALENRFGLDFFAGSVQGYLNPYSHLPFYWMVKQGFAPQFVAAGLALIHVLNLVLVYEIAILLNKRQDGHIAWLPVWLAVFLAFCNPIFILELGSTFNDITTSVPVLAGWYLLIRGFEAPRRKHLLVAGMLIGIAVALKLSNLYFAVAALPLLLCAPTSLKARAYAILAVAAGGVLGLLLAGGWWGWQLWQHFGNPLFPMFNQFFLSPDVTASPLSHQRFIPGSFSEIILKPFSMVVPRANVHVETIAPDSRYALLFVLFGLFALQYLRRVLAAGKPARPEAWRGFRGNRLLAALSASFVLAWVAWAFSSGNSRYFLPMSCLGAVILASLFFRITKQWRFLVYGGVLVVVAQGALALLLSSHRWAPVGWGEQWFELDIPAELQTQPALYLQTMSQPAAFLMPYLPRQSAMVSTSGVYVVDEDRPQLRALLEKHRGNVRVMLRSPRELEAANADEFKFFLARFGLEADIGDCADIRSRIRMPEFPEGRYLHYIACRTKPREWTQEEREAFDASRRRANAVFDRLETVCPQLFQPRGLHSEGDGKQFWRNYANTDTVLQLHGTGMVSYRNVFTRERHRLIGNIDAIEKDMPARAAVCP